MFQFNRGFGPGPSNAAYVVGCRHRLRSDATMAIEFRHHGWFAGSAGEAPGDPLFDPDALFSSSGTSESSPAASGHHDEHASACPHRLGVFPHLLSPSLLEGAEGASAPTRSPEEEAASDATAAAPPRTQMAATLHLLNHLDAALIAADELQHEWEGVNVNRPSKPPSKGGKGMPIHLYVTSTELVYIRVHRREGTNRLLDDEELDKWAARLRRLTRGDLAPPRNCVPILFHWGTIFEDHAQENARRLTQRVSDVVVDWPAFVRSQEEHKGLLAFFQSGSKGGGEATDEPEPKRPRTDQAEEDDHRAPANSMRSTTLLNFYPPQRL